MGSVEKVYPSAEELSRISKNQNCPECSATFNSESNLNLHLAKTHRKPHLLQSSNKVFYCPEKSCPYNQQPHFKKLNALKQHYLKVHSERNYRCGACEKAFSTESDCNRHAEYCHVTFKCCDCEMFYGCYETLKTHGRRKKHNILEKSAYKTSLKKQKSDEFLPANKMKLILPRLSTSTGMIFITDTSDQSCQTEKSSQETQTLLAAKMPHLTVETQTIGDYFTKKPETADLKSTKTQTATANANASCNTSFSVDEFELNEVQRSSSSTQTTIFKEPMHPSTSTHSIHTDTSDLLTEIFDCNFINCNTETQTDFIFNDEMFKYCDDYTNMYTQTCEDLLLGDIRLSDTHTQTVFDDVLKSVESQTIMSQSRKVLLGKDSMTHMETQTDNYFKQILEEINA